MQYVSLYSFLNGAPAERLVYFMHKSSCTGRIGIVAFVDIFAMGEDTSLYSSGFQPFTAF